MPTRRELIKGAAGGAAALPLGASLAGVAPPPYEKIRISGFELTPTRVPMDERVREAWQASFFRQNRFQTHYEAIIVRIKTDAGVTGIGDAMMPADQARRLLEQMTGHSPRVGGCRGAIPVTRPDRQGLALLLQVVLFEHRPPDVRVVFSTT